MFVIKREVFRKFLSQSSDCQTKATVELLQFVLGPNSFTETFNVNLILPFINLKLTKAISLLAN